MRNRYEIKGDVTVIYISRKGEVFETTISTSDFDKVNSFPSNWYAVPNKMGSYYIIGKLGEMFILLHRWIFNLPGQFLIDHINHNTLDNTRKNLRVVTITGNNQNRGAGRKSSSGIRGVNWDKEKSKWKVQVGANGKNHHIGYFTDKEEAKEAAIKARKRLLPFSVD